MWSWSIPAVAIAGRHIVRLVQNMCTSFWVLFWGSSIPGGHRSDRSSESISIKSLKGVSILIGPGTATVRPSRRLLRIFGWVMASDGTTHAHTGFNKYELGALVGNWVEEKALQDATGSHRYQVCFEAAYYRKITVGRLAKMLRCVVTCPV